MQNAALGHGHRARRRTRLQPWTRAGRRSRADATLVHHHQIDATRDMALLQMFSAMHRQKGQLNWTELREGPFSLSRFLSPSPLSLSSPLSPLSPLHHPLLRPPAPSTLLWSPSLLIIDAAAHDLRFCLYLSILVLISIYLSSRS